MTDWGHEATRVRGMLEREAQAQINAYGRRFTGMFTQALDEVQWAGLHREYVWCEGQVQEVREYLGAEAHLRDLREVAERLRERREWWAEETSPAYRAYEADSRVADRAIARMERSEMGMTEVHMTAEAYQDWRLTPPEERAAWMQRMQRALVYDGVHGAVVVLTPDEECAFSLTITLTPQEVRDAYAREQARLGEAEALPGEWQQGSRGQMPEEPPPSTNWSWEAAKTLYGIQHDQDRQLRDFGDRWRGIFDQALMHVNWAGIKRDWVVNENGRSQEVLTEKGWEEKAQDLRRAIAVIGEQQDLRAEQWHREHHQQQHEAAPTPALPRQVQEPTFLTMLEPEYEAWVQAGSDEEHEARIEHLMRERLVQEGHEGPVCMLTPHGDLAFSFLLRDPETELRMAEEYAFAPAELAHAREQLRIAAGEPRLEDWRRERIAELQDMLGMYDPVAPEWHDIQDEIYRLQQAQANEDGEEYADVPRIEIDTSTPEMEEDFQQLLARLDARLGVLTRETAQLEQQQRMHY